MGSAVRVAKRVHHPIQGADAHLHPPLLQQQCLQIAQGPDRDGKSVRLRPLVECLVQEGQGGRIQLGRAPTPRPVGQAGTPFS